jgi:hypothetical protein
MDPRRLKVGDIVDDYCPRERRLTDHAIVAMVDETIQKTRCIACDNEHPYKEARTPRARRKTTPAALYQEVLTNVTEGAPAAPQSSPEPLPPVVAAEGANVTIDQPAPKHEAAAPVDEPPAADEGPVHRPLIRATLPRPQGDTPPGRPIPEFTIRQSGGRGGRFGNDFRGNSFRASGRNGSGHPGQSRQGRPGGSSNQQSRGPRRGRPGPHKKRSR